MILHINHVQPERAALASSVVSTLVSLAGDAQIPSRILDNLNVHLEWVQYKTNFREAVTLRRVNRGDEVLPWMEVGIDLRQAHPETLKQEFINALRDPSDPACAPFSTFLSCPRNIGAAFSKGWEASAGVSLLRNQPFAKNLDLQAQYTNTLTRDLTTNNRLQRWPVDQWSALLSYQPVEPLVTTLAVRYVGSRFNDLLNHCG